MNNFKSEYTANVTGFTCAPVQPQRKMTVEPEVVKEEKFNLVSLIKLVTFVCAAVTIADMMNII